MAETNIASPPVRFETHPDRYKHWKLSFEGPIATLLMDVQEDGGMRAGYPLKLNSYDLGVDIELADALQRIRFEHPEVKALVVGSAKDRIFCSGANIYMLGSSTHAFKVNFCKFTNETRLWLEELSEGSGVRSLCALAGTASGGGYELALACDEILLTDDGSSAVSLPECPLLGVLPGTGGLTRVVDKRKVRRDLADAFCTLAEGVRGKRAVEWGLVDETAPRAKFEDAKKRRADALVAASTRKTFKPMTWSPLGFHDGAGSSPGGERKYVQYTIDEKARTAKIVVSAPKEPQPDSPEALEKTGVEAWCVRAFRELDAALLDLRFNQPLVGTVAIETTGDPNAVLAVDAMLAKHKDHGLVNEVRLFIRRTLKRMDVTAKTFFAVVAPGSCFAGTLLELALASDRIYMKDEDGVSMQVSPMNAGPFPMGNGLTRLQSRFLKEPERVNRVLETKAAIDTQAASKLGLATFTPDDIDWDDEIRIAFEERAAMSPDAMTGMEASLRFAGPETLETKIFGRLSAWQNWIFQRPNAVGERGALTMYGRPERPEFDWRRT
ncbi:MAG TPA: 2,3-epoxybenzoyl-CoA dihydrolase [Polyangiaceae bacterium]|jgi:benzoyl-CoA-dihydrodiol lyase|nr:2,3-epoxybenzoyl-CoA dihydrolase [Polyangiaceae bacterium]